MPFVYSEKSDTTDTCLLEMSSVLRLNYSVHVPDVTSIYFFFLEFITTQTFMNNVNIGISSCWNLPQFILSRDVHLMLCIYLTLNHIDRDAIWIGRDAANIYRDASRRMT